MHAKAAVEPGSNQSGNQTQGLPRCADPGGQKHVGVGIVDAEQFVSVADDVNGDQRRYCETKENL